MSRDSILLNALTEIEVLLGETYWLSSDRFANVLNAIADIVERARYDLQRYISGGNNA